MLKNKKKLRRQERRSAVTRTAQTLVLTGALLLGGAGLAGAADYEINASGAVVSSTANALTSIEKLLVTFTDDTAVNVTFADALVNTTGGLTITGGTGAATLTVDNSAAFAGAVIVNGSATNAGTLQINAGKTFTSSHANGTTVGDYGVLTLNGDANSGAIHAGNVTLNGGNSAILTVTGGKLDAQNQIGGKLVLTDGTADIYGTGATFLTVSGGTAGGASDDGVAIAKGTLTVGNGAGNASTITVTNNTTIAASGANDAKLLLNAGTHVGNITLNSGNAVANTILAAGAGHGTVTGDVTATKGVIDVTGGNLTVSGKLLLNSVDNNGALANVSNNTLKVGGTATITRGTLTLGNAGNAGTLQLVGDNKLVVSDTSASNAAAANAVLKSDGANASTANKLYGAVELGKGTLNLNGGTLTVYSAPATISGALPATRGTVSITSDTVLTGTANGALVTGTLSVAGGVLKSANGSTVAITADKLALAAATTLGDGTDANTGVITTTIKGGTKTAEFLGNALTIKGNTTDTVTLSLSAADSTNGGTSTYGITLDGSDAAKTLLNITQGDWTLGSLTVTKGAVAQSGGIARTTLSIGNDGYANITSGALMHNGAFSIAAADLVNNGTTTGKQLGVGGLGSFHVKGALNLTDVVGEVTSTFTGTVLADSLALSDSTKKYTQNTGKLVLFGSAPGASFLTASGLDVKNSSTVQLGDTATSHATNGGTYANQVTVNGGTLAVAKGDWSLSKVDVKDAANSALTISGGTLTVGELKTAGNSNSVLTVNPGGTLSTGLSNFGTIATAAGHALDRTGTPNVNSATKIAGNGALVLTGTSGYAGNLSVTEAGAIRTSVMSGNGTLLLKDYTVSATKADALSSASGLDVSTFTVGLAASDTLTANTVVKNLEVQTAVTGAVATVLNGNTLTIVGTKAGDTLIAGTDSTKVVTITTGTGTLALGSATSASPTGGVLNAAVTNTGGAIAATNGTFVIDGAVTTGGTGNLSATNGSLTLNKSITGNVGTVTANAGSVTAKTGNVVATTTSLTGGTLATSDTTAGNGNLNAGTVTLQGTGNKLSASNDLTVTSFTDGTTNGKVSNTTITAGNDMTVTNNGITATASTINVTKNLTLSNDGALSATGSKLTVTGTLATGSGTITAASGSALKVGTLSQANAGNIEVKGGSSLTVGTLTGNSGENITIGAAGSKADGSTLTATNTNLNSGTLQVLNAKASLGTLTAATGTLFVDPAYVNIAGISGNVGSALLMGKEGVITVGSLNEAWVRQAIKDAKAPADSSVLGLQKSIALTGSGQIVVDKAATNAANGGIAAAAGMAAYFGDKSLLALDGSQFLSNDPTKAAIVAGNGGALYTSNTAGEAAKLHITGVKAGQTVYVVSTLTNAAVDLTDATKSWQNGNITFDTALLAGTGATNTDKNLFNVNVRGVAATSVFPKLSASMGGLVDNVMPQYAVNSDNAGVRFVSRAVSNDYGLGAANATRAAATIEGAAQMAAVGAVPGVTLGAVTAATSAVTGRTAFASPLMDPAKAVAMHRDTEGNLSLDTGLSAGSNMRSGLGLWLMPLYQSNNVWGMKAENFKSGYNSDLFGIALGADYTIDSMYRFGLALNMGGGYAQSSGDFNKTDNNFNFWGVNLYGGWTQNNFGLTADVGYTGTYNKVQQDMPAAMQMNSLKSDVTAGAWAAGLRGEYKWETGMMDIIPHVGVRYTGLTTNGYDVKSNGTVFNVDESFQNLWTFPVGVTFTKAIESGSGWQFKPQLDLGVIPAAGDVKAKSNVRIPGVNSSAEMKMQVVDYVTFDGGLGFDLKKDNVSFGLNYNIQASEHRTGHGVFGTFRYEF